jgi:hypothetical protein
MILPLGSGVCTVAHQPKHFISDATVRWRTVPFRFPG